MDNDEARIAEGLLTELGKDLAEGDADIEAHEQARYQLLNGRVPVALATMLFAEARPETELAELADKLKRVYIGNWLPVWIDQLA